MCHGTFSEHPVMQIQAMTTPAETSKSRGNHINRRCEITYRNELVTTSEHNKTCCCRYALKMGRPTQNWQMHLSFRGTVRRDVSLRNVRRLYTLHSNERLVWRIHQSGTSKGPFFGQAKALNRAIRHSVAGIVPCTVNQTLMTTRWKRGKTCIRLLHKVDDGKLERVTERC